MRDIKIIHGHWHGPYASTQWHWPLLYPVLAAQRELEEPRTRRVASAAASARRGRWGRWQGPRGVPAPARLQARPGARRAPRPHRPPGPGAAPLPVGRAAPRWASLSGPRGWRSGLGAPAPKAPKAETGISAAVRALLERLTRQADSRQLAAAQFLNPGRTSNGQCQSIQIHTTYF
jgi:hypothetical protein